MPRPKRPVILRKDNAYKRFDSIAEAADFLGVRSQALHVVLKHHSRHHSICGFTAEYESEFVPQPKKDNTERHEGLEVEIDGITYRAQVNPNRVCADCDIYKENPPRFMTQYPMCFDYSLRTHRVVDYCSANHQLIWVKVKK